MVSVISFDEAISDSFQFSKRHLFLGNGFSIACCPNIFHYGTLFEKADFSKNPELVRVFDALDTQDFEVVVRNLESGARLIPIYTPLTLESIHKVYKGLQSFLSMERMEASLRKARDLMFNFSQSLASLRHRPSHANVLSTTHRRGRTSKPFAVSDLLTISILMFGKIFFTA